jgi:hypothetical protein
MSKNSVEFYATPEIIKLLNALYQKYAKIAI